MVCTFCGGKVKEENYEKICTSCGSVQESMFLTEKVCSTGSSFAYFPSNEIDTFHYKSFKRLFHLVADNLLYTHKYVICEAEIFLPRLWNVLKWKQIEKKKNYFNALLYVIYRKNSPLFVSVKQFCSNYCTSSFSRKYIINIKLWCNLSLKYAEDYSKEISECIKELAKGIFQNADAEILQKANSLANDLSSAIIENNWFKMSTTYVACVAGAATYIAAEYVIRLHSKTFPFSKKYLNVALVSKILCISKKTLTNTLREVKMNMYKVAKELPIKMPATITNYRQIYIFVEEVCKYADYNEKEDFTHVPVIPGNIKSTVIDCFTSLVKPMIDATQSDNDTKLELKLDYKQLKISVIESLKTANKENEVDSENAVLVLKDNTGLQVHGHVFRYHLFELMFDLLLAQCPLDEMKSRNYIELSKDYLDKDSVTEENLPEMTNAEIHIYLKDSFVDTPVQY